MPEGCAEGAVNFVDIDRLREAAIFKALGDEKRLRMLDTVAANPGICACKLLEKFEMSQSTLSHHMSLLKAAGFVTCEKHGKWCHYSLSNEGFESASRYIGEMLQS